MQAKHQSLLKRVDALYEECEELQGLLGECEDKQDDLLNQLRLTTEEKERVHAQLTEQQVEDTRCSCSSSLDLVCNLWRFCPTGPVFKAPEGEADATSRRQSAKKQLGCSEGACANLTGEGETQPTANKARK